MPKKTKPTHGRRSLNRLDGLRRYLEANIKQMQTAQARAVRGHGWKGYWKVGIRTMKKHLTTVKMVEKRMQTIDKGERP